MKIAIISPAYPLRGGIAQLTALLTRHLESSGHDVHILNYKRQYPNLLFPGKSQFVTDGDTASQVPSEIIVDSIGPWSWFKTYRRIRKLAADLVIIRYWMPFFAPCLGSITWLVHRFTLARVLYLCDNIIPHERRPGDKLLTRFAFRHADYFILQSDYVRRDLLSLFPRAEHRVIPHPVYEIFGRSIAKSKARRKLHIQAKRVILFFGLVRTYKGLDILLRAMPMILKETQLHLLVVGEFYEDEAAYHNLITELGIAEAVQIEAGFVPDDKVPTYFSAADLLVLPYKSATQSGIVQLAYHFDRPCLVTDVGGLSEVVEHGHTGYVVKPESPESVAAAVIAFYREKQEARFVENVRQEKQKYSWARMVEGIEELVMADD